MSASRSVHQRCWWRRPCVLHELLVACKSRQLSSGGSIARRRREFLRRLPAQRPPATPRLVRYRDRFMASSNTYRQRPLAGPAEHKRANLALLAFGARRPRTPDITWPQSLMRHRGQTDVPMSSSRRCGESASSDLIGRFTKIEIRFVSIPERIGNGKPPFRCIAGCHGSIWQPPQCAVIGCPGQTGQRSAATSSPSVKTKSKSGAPGTANSLLSLERKVLTSKSVFRSRSITKGCTCLLGGCRPERRENFQALRVARWPRP